MPVKSGRFHTAGADLIEIIPRFAVVRVELEGSFKLGDRLRETVLADEHDAQIHMADRVARVQANGFGIFCDSSRLYRSGLYGLPMATSASFICLLIFGHDSPEQKPKLRTRTGC